MSDSATLWNSFLGAEVVYWDAAGVRTRCIEAGDGPPLILLHGTGGHVEAWAHNFSALAEHFRVIAVDMVGNGLTGKPKDLEYVITDYTTHLRSLMDSMDVPTAHFAGISLGGWVASWLALETPERVDRIVNCTGGVFRWPEGQEEGESKERQEMVKTNEALEVLTRDSVRKRLHLLFHDPSRCPEELVDLRLRIYSQPGMDEIVPKLHNMIPYDSPARRKFALTEERLAALSSPVLYLWGQFNTGGSVRSAERAARLTPTAELVVIPDAGHWVQWEAPDAFNRATTEFLNSGHLR